MKLISLLALVSTSSAFFNMDLIDFNNLDVNTFDFEMVYGMDILALKYRLIQESTETFLKKVTEVQIAEIERLVGWTIKETDSIMSGSMNPNTITEEF